MVIPSPSNLAAATRAIGSPLRSASVGTKAAKCGPGVRVELTDYTDNFDDPAIYFHLGLFTPVFGIIKTDST
jgi:hypothetical protein